MDVLTAICNCHVPGIDDTHIKVPENVPYNKVLNASGISFTGIKNAKATKVTIPATVKIGGKTFKVTAIAAGALKNKKKLTAVTIGKNVTTIGANAFFGCRKLGTITIQSTKLRSVGKNAYKGIKEAVKIKVPKTKENRVVKLMFLKKANPG